MSKIKRIIVGVDAHAASAAGAALGARLATGLGAGLELFTPVYNSQVSLAHFEDRESLQHARDMLVQRHRGRLEEIGSALQFDGEVECHAAWDHPAEEALIRHVLDRAADLLVVELPEGADTGARPLSSAQWQLVRHCPAPLLLTRGRLWGEKPVVVASVDPGGRHGHENELDTRILQVADSIGRGTGGTLHAFHAWEKSLHGMIGAFTQPLAPELPGDETLRRHREAVESALSAAAVAPARVSLVEGQPESMLPDYCSEAGADVAVMGAIARNPFGRIFIGSTAERVLDRLPCDLLVVKPESFSTPVARERWPREESPPPVLGVPGI